MVQSQWLRELVHAGGQNNVQALVELGVDGRRRVLVGIRDEHL
jgi:hypothetical protein